MSAIIGELADISLIFCLLSVIYSLYCYVYIVQVVANHYPKVEVPLENFLNAYIGNLS